MFWQLFLPTAETLYPKIVVLQWLLTVSQVFFATCTIPVHITIDLTPSQVSSTPEEDLSVWLFGHHLIPLSGIPH